MFSDSRFKMSGLFWVLQQNFRRVGNTCIIFAAWSQEDDIERYSSRGCLHRPGQGTFIPPPENQGRKKYIIKFFALFGWNKTSKNMAKYEQK
jgi:hypothetical protein